MKNCLFLSTPIKKPKGLEKLASLQNELLKYLDHHKVAPITR